MAYDDWSDLITVNYEGGKGGEFFAFLLYECHHGEVEYIKIKENKYRYMFKDYDPLSSSVIWHMGYLSKDYSDIPLWADSTFIEEIEKVKKIYYTENREDYILNLRDYFSLKYFPKHSKNNITKMHNFIREDGIYIQELFPKSTNYNLICKNESENFIFKILFIHKVLVQRLIFKNKNNIINPLNNKGSFTLDYFVDHEVKFFPQREKGIIVDVFDFYINQNHDKYELNFNKKKLNAYREDILTILDSVEIDPYKEYTREEKYKKIEKCFYNAQIK